MQNLTLVSCNCDNTFITGKWNPKTTQTSATACAVENSLLGGSRGQKQEIHLKHEVLRDNISISAPTLENYNLENRFDSLILETAGYRFLSIHSF